MRIYEDLLGFTRIYEDLREFRCNYELVLRAYYANYGVKRPLSFIFFLLARAGHIIRRGRDLRMLGIETEKATRCCLKLPFLVFVSVT